MTHWSISHAVFRTELRTLLRDRRAFLMAVVFPMLVFPLVFFGMDRLERASKDSLAKLELTVAYDLTALDAGLAAEILVELGRTELHLVLEPCELEALQSEDPVSWREPAERLLGGTPVLCLVGAPASLEPDALPTLRMVFDGADNQANEAHRRLDEQLSARRADWRLEKLIEAFERDPGGSLELDAHDVASAEDAAGHSLGSLLPIILVMIVISSASFAALGAFAGEREEGTIETLLVQPVPARDVAVGKFLAVLLTGVLAAVGNTFSFVASTALGLGGAELVSAEGALATSLGRTALGLFLFLPALVFLCALLALISARARSFREGQHYVLPVVLVAALFAAVSTQDSVPSSLLFAFVPITGSTLTLRDCLAGALPLGGSPQWLPAIAGFLATSAWAWLLLGRLATTLDAERLFRTRESASELAQRHFESRRALVFGLLSIALVYIVGGRLQTAHTIGGLLVTLLLLVPGLALAAARGTARRTGESMTRVLGLARPTAAHLCGAFFFAPLAVVAIQALFRWQGEFLPIPEDGGYADLLAELSQLSPWALFAIFALAPGIAEELLFRGAILRGLREDLPALKIILWQALLFGAVHASLYRFLGTALLGGVLAAITLRARCLWPAILLHTVYNGLTVLDAPTSDLWNPSLAVAGGSIGTLLFLLPPRAREHAAEEGEPS